ncbi:helix-turn-helix domain-containing protein [Culturomica massiliensis]|uniref:helix-turn-helix domain-containing protein n=1 Tax=Culturomica massiliensis TaxID=1841857 RepID=UPI000839031A|nr:helix-turn-helix transcriptional regulator [Culturomica massiliensis]
MEKKKKQKKEKTPIEKYVIAQVRKKRKELNMTQAELNDSLGFGSGFVGQVESNKCPSKYNLNHLNKLAEIFDCSIRDFFPEKYLKKIGTDNS